MKIYTRTGDKGETSLLGGVRVSKADARIEAYGTIDELNATLGMLAQVVDVEDRQWIRRIQSQLFTIGSHLAAGRSEIPIPLPTFSDSETKALEADIDRRQAEIPPMRNFILPGSCIPEAWAHIARTICRRAERHLVRLHAIEPVSPIFLEYLNRLSDWLFVLGRHITYKVAAEEIPWKAAK
ncbi:MAG: cob(I)yrinic acid a,c-diamide adenosyltransferase [Bacteroidia bacterium]|nr:cob(I)yrinic acid a,c-diamide adenosyltransferase [Bacteroidia bacterium]MDW8135099.1 cob(I)yrinic acid a,c-diamide adenosyltransferase [Bacteroidia bacterium]